MQEQKNLVETLFARTSPQLYSELYVSSRHGWFRNLSIFRCFVTYRKSRVGQTDRWLVDSVMLTENADVSIVPAGPYL